MKNKLSFCKGLLAACVGLSTVAGCLCLPTALPASAEVDTAWKVVKEAGDSPWTVTENEGATTITLGAKGDTGSNFLVKQDANAVGNYSVSMHFEMEANPMEGAPDGRNSQVGLVPFYLDDNNYIMFNIWWRTDSWCGGNGNVIANITMQGKQNGEFIHVWNGSSYAPAEWSDVWTNNAVVSTAALRTPINKDGGYTFTINKRVGDPGFTCGITGDMIEVLIDGVSYGFYSTDLTASYRNAPYYVGMTAANAEGLTVTNFNVADCNMSMFDFPYSDYNYNPLEGSNYVATGKNWVYDAGKISVDAMLGGRTESPYEAITKVDASYTNYSVSADVAITEKAADAMNTAGVTAWQKDHANDLTANLVYADGGYKAVIGGVINGEAVNVESAALNITDDAATLNVKKAGSTVILSVNGAEACRYTNLALAANGFAGVNAKYAKAEFTNVSIEKYEYQSFDEYQGTLLGATYALASKTEFDFISGDGYIAVDGTEFDSYGYAVLGRDTWSTTAVTSTFTPVSVGATYAFGMIAYYENAQSFIYAVINGTKAEIYSRNAEGDTLVASADYAYDATSAITLTAVVEAGKVSLKAGDSVLVEGEIADLNPDNGKNGGIVVKGANVQFTAPEFDGWRSWDALQVGDYTAIGPEIGTWSVAEDGTVTGRAANIKVERNTTFAVKEIEYSYNYYVYGVIHVTAVHTNWERRAYYMPWYVDNDNWVGVYCSQIPGMNPEIVAEAKINGGYINMAWTGYAGCASILDADVVMEVYVGENGIEVYNGKSSTPFWTYDVPGLKAASEGKTVKAGVGVVDVTVDFKNFTVGEEMMSKNTVAPTISLVNTPATTGTVGKTIMLPIIDVIDDLGESINAVVTVVDPDGAEVDLAGAARFTPSKAGTYTVTISAEDSWGNKAEDYVYTITVAEETTEQPGGDKPGDEKPGEEKPAGGCGSVVIGGVAMAIVALGACTVMFARKREE